jgi:hypothetical protein
VHAAADRGEPYTVGQLADRYGISRENAKIEISAAALADARESRNSGEPRTADELAARYRIDREEAEDHVDYADNVPSDSDWESD